MSARLERVFEPSRIRRGRLATSPTWYVALDDGARWRFYRKGDAVRFISDGCECVVHVDDTFGCKHCRGQRVAEPVVELAELLGRIVGGT